MIRARLLPTLIPLLLAPAASADVHTVVINEYSLQCDDGSTDAQYVELRSAQAGNFFRNCTSIQIKRTNGGADLVTLDPVFVGRGDAETFAVGKTFLIATPAFQSVTGIVPDVVVPDGSLPVAGGVIRLAAEGGCTLVDWGTIHEVQYGDQGAAPVPGPGQAANYRERTHSFSVGTPSPMNFDGASETTWTCMTVPAESSTWGRLKALYRN